MSEQGGIVVMRTVTLGRKFCSDCGIWRPIHDFRPYRWWPDDTIRTVRSKCRVCDNRMKTKNRSKPDPDHVYADARPFTEAVNEWLERYQQRTYSSPWGWMSKQPRRAGLLELGRRGGMPAREIARIADSEMSVIGIGNADKLAIALDIPLCLLAEDFMPLGEARRRFKRVRMTEVAA